MHRYIKFVALAFLAILILWFFGRSLDWTEVWSSLRKANAFQLFLATAIICLGYLLRAFRWKTLLSPITKSSLRELFATTTVGFAAVFLFGRAAEVVRPLWLPMRDKRVRPSAALVTIGVERICDLVAIALVFAINFLWFRAPVGREAEFAAVNRAGILILAGTVLGITALFIFQHFSAPIIAKTKDILGKMPLPNRLTAIFISILNHLSASLQVLRNPRELALTVMWTITLWFAISLPTWLVISAFGLQLSFSDALFVMGAASLGSLVPTPGGAAGAFHAVTASALMSLGVNRDDAAAVAIVMHLVYFAPALVFGFYYFLHGDITWEKLRSLVISDEPTTDVQLKIQNEKLKVEEKDFTHSTAH
ncbi:MAG: lysylphosphatidylglycerol synthase transmembrane domain-containing protein [Pyrinomonadaceae bacterium]